MLTLMSVVALASLTSAQLTGLTYSGGSISSYHVRQINQSHMRMHIIVTTGWKLGFGPCGSPCHLAQINTDNTAQVRRLIQTGGRSYLGNWKEGIGSATSFIAHDITDYVNSHITSHVIDVSSQDNWELEVLEFDYDASLTAQYSEITYSGMKWRRYQRDGIVYQQEVQLSLKLQPQIRNDTGLPNSTPITIFKPVYRIPLNQVTIIHLAPVDADDDAVICEAPSFAATGGIHIPRNVTVHKDCRVEVRAFEALGYADNGWEALAVVMTDYNRKPITLGDDKTVRKPYLRAISQMSIQFMVHTVRTVKKPQMIAPTPVDQHVYLVDVNTLLEIPIFARSDSTIKSYHVASLPAANITLISPMMPVGKLLWRPGRHNVGTYLVTVIALDANGMESDERIFILKVRDREPFTLLKHPTEPIFAYVPQLATFQCRFGYSCIIAVPVITSFRTSNVRGEPGVTLVEWTGPYPSVSGTERHQADILIENLQPGSYKQCLRFEEASRNFNKTVCVDVSVNNVDPCEMLPCLHFGECEANGANFTCHCQRTNTGRLCENAIDFCSPSPCVQGKCYHSFSSSGFFCQCDAGWTGVHCDTAITTSTTTTTTTPTTTPATSSSTLTASTLTSTTSTVPLTSSAPPTTSTRPPTSSAPPTTSTRPPTSSAPPTTSTRPPTSAPPTTSTTKQMTHTSTITTRTTATTKSSTVTSTITPTITRTDTLTTDSQSSSPGTSASASSLPSNATQSTCHDKDGVDCVVLVGSTSICHTPIGNKYCAKYCKLC